MELEMATLDNMLRELEKREDEVIIIRVSRREDGSHEGAYMLTQPLHDKPALVAKILAQVATTIAPGVVQMIEPPGP